MDATGPIPKPSKDRRHPTLAEKLLVFFLLFNISHRAMLYLLVILKEEGFSVPNSIYMLKKLSMNSKVDVIKSTLNCGGQFAYLSIIENIKYCIQSKLIVFHTMYNELKIAINIDGIPLFRSSPVNLWPILLSFKNCNFEKPLPIAIYVGISKPNFTGFISQLHQELLLLQNYFDIGGVFIKVIDIVFICDAPARAFLQCVKSHSGYDACPYCRIHGVYDGKVVFPFTGVKHEERTDENYYQFLENNQHSRSPLADVVSLKSAFPMEYMHLICLGVVRRLLQSYLSNTHGLLPCRLSEGLKAQLDECVRKYCHVLPVEFQRKIRFFLNLCYFKASEFRTVVLYTGPVFLRKVLSPDYYKHFLLLHFAIFVFVSPDYVHLYDAAKECIERFLLQLHSLFTSSAYTYNAHCLLHLYDFVKLYGPLDTFSAFPFENYLYSLKRRIKSGTFVLSQSINTLRNIRDSYVNMPPRNLFFSSSHPNNCALVCHNNSRVPILIDSVHYHDNTQLVSGRLFKFVADLYSYPYPSSTLGIGQFYLSNAVLKNVVPVSKCIVFPDTDNYIIMPFACAQSEQ